MSSPVSARKRKSGASSPSRTTRASSRRAVGVVRVSRVGDRTGERFVSPGEQRERIEAACERDGLTLVDVQRELDVSGGAPLARRPGLRRAVEMIEGGEADVIVVAYLDRLVRSLSVQAEVVSRVEGAGGAILALDVGELTADTASRWLSGTMLGAVAEYHRRATAERTEEAKRRAVERGVPPFPNVPPGYRKREDGRLEPDPETARAVAAAFDLRASGATIMDVRNHLRANGIERSFHGVQAFLGSRIVLGELRFGERINDHAHAAIVAPEVFERVQRMKLPRGRRPNSQRLLARLGVLRCGTCGARMVTGTTVQSGKTYAFYRCPPVGDCPRRVTISADVAEKAVVEAVQALLADVRGTANLESGVEQAERELSARQDELDAAIRTLAPVGDERAAQERLAELRQARDEARERLADLAEAAPPAVTVTAGDWDLLTPDERRALIRAVVERADVAPGRGPDRITVRPRSE
jgi:DNA invertase Pin-like site-specific DNA recombinase